MKYEVPKFDGETSVSLWKIRMQLSLVLQGQWKTIKEKFSSDSGESKIELKDKVLIAIFMSVTDNVLHESLDEKMLFTA